MSIMYHVTTDPDALGSMSEDAFYDSLGALGADYVQDQGPEDSAYAVDALIKRLANAGFAPVRPGGDTDGTEAFRFESGDEAAMDARKDRWFSDVFKELQRKTAGMSLAEFSRSTGPAYGLAELVNDRFGDHVYLDMGTGPAAYTLPSFIRNMEPGKTYYVSANTVYLH